MIQTLDEEQRAKIRQLCEQKGSDMSDAERVKNMHSDCQRFIRNACCSLPYNEEWKTAHAIDRIIRSIDNPQRNTIDEAREAFKEYIDFIEGVHQKRVSERTEYAIEVIMGKAEEEEEEFGNSPESLVKRVRMDPSHKEFKFSWNARHCDCGLGGDYGCKCAKCHSHGLIRCPDRRGHDVKTCKHCRYKQMVDEPNPEHLKEAYLLDALQRESTTKIYDLTGRYWNDTHCRCDSDYCKCAVCGDHDLVSCPLCVRKQ